MRGDHGAGVQVAGQIGRLLVGQFADAMSGQALRVAAVDRQNEQVEPPTAQKRVEALVETAVAGVVRGGSQGLRRRSRRTGGGRWRGSRSRNSLRRGDGGDVTSPTLTVRPASTPATRSGGKGRSAATACASSSGTTNSALGRTPGHGRPGGAVDVIEVVVAAQIRFAFHCLLRASAAAPPAGPCGARGRRPGTPR